MDTADDPDEVHVKLLLSTPDGATFRASVLIGRVGIYPHDGLNPSDLPHFLHNLLTHEPPLPHSIQALPLLVLKVSHKRTTFTSSHD